MGRWTWDWSVSPPELELWIWVDGGGRERERKRERGGLKQGILFPIMNAEKERKMIRISSGFTYETGEIQNTQVHKLRRCLHTPRVAEW